MAAKRRRLKARVAWILVLGLWGLASAGWAEEPGRLEQPLEKKIIEGASLADLLAYAYKTNPMIQAARHAWRGTIERYRVETAYPDPEIGLTAYPKPFMALYELMVSQTIPFPGKLSRTGEVAKAEIEMARLGLNKTLRDILAGIRESYYELLYIREAKKVVAMNREILEHIRKIGETAYAQDRAKFFDVVKAQSQAAQLQYDAVLLEELERTEKAQLNSLLNRPPGSEIKLLEGEPLPALVYPLEEIYELAKKHREEIRLVESEIQKAKAKQGVAKYESLPDFKLGASYEKGNPDNVPPEYRDTIGIQIGLTIPLWFQKNKGRRDEARAEEQKALAMKTAQINETQALIRNAYFRLRNSERLIQLYRDQLLPQAANALEIAETWFREKQGSFTDFLETESVFYNFQLSLARAKADYGRNLAQLERLAGVSLTANGQRNGDKRRGGEGR